VNRTGTLRRHKWLRRGTQPLRRTRLRAKGGSLFPHRRNPAYRAWIRTFPCVVPGCEGAAEPCHVIRKSQGGDDVGNLYPGCRRHHDEQHEHGTLGPFERKYGLDLAQIAAGYGEGWAQLRGLPF